MKIKLVKVKRPKRPARILKRWLISNEMFWQDHTHDMLRINNQHRDFKYKE